VLMRVKTGVTNYYIYGLGLQYEITETATSTNTLTYHYDYRGSTVALTDSSGNVTDRIEYSPYGMTTYRAGTNDTPFLFNGRYGVMTDPNGLLFMRARYYNPYLCRFLNADPSGFGGGLNFYAYADGNPISMIDPFGLNAVGDYFYDVGQVFVGYGQAVGGTVTGVYNAAAHPVDTAVGLYNVGAHPVQAYNAISQSVVNTWNSGLQGQGRIVGNVLIAAGTVGAGTTMGSARLAGISDTLAEAATDASYAQKVIYYEVGQKTFAGEIPSAFAAIANPVDRGAQIVADLGWRAALQPEGTGWMLGIGKTFSTDPTPLGWFGVSASGLASQAGQLGQYGNSKGTGGLK
jgi:RHS repeat-associated protein